MWGEETGKPLAPCDKAPNLGSLQVADTPLEELDAASGELRVRAVPHLHHDAGRPHDQKPGLQLLGALRCADDEFFLPCLEVPETESKPRSDGWAWALA